MLILFFLMIALVISLFIIAMLMGNDYNTCIVKVEFLKVLKLHFKLQNKKPRKIKKRVPGT